MKTKAPSINKIVIFIAVAFYLVVNIGMQINFFAGRNIFSKYQIPTSPIDALRIAQDAYYAKTGWLVILLVLQAFNVPFGLACGLSFACYAIAMLIFFGFNPSTTAYAVVAVALLASYFVKWPRSNHPQSEVAQR